MERILLVDTMGSLFYHFHTKEVQVTASFLSNLQSIIATYKINQVYMLQEGGSGYRNELLPTYKAARKARREKYTEAEKAAYATFVEAANYTCEVLRMLGVGTIQHWGAEADDLAGYICSVLPSEEYQILLMNEDSDWQQLLCRKNTVWGSYKAMAKAMPKLSPDLWVSYNRYQRDNDWTVEQSYQAKLLCGDTSDSIPGIDGLGTTGAANLIKHYGSLEEVLRNADNIAVPRITSKAKEGLLQATPTLELGHKLMNLRWAPKEWERILKLTDEHKEKLFDQPEMKLDEFKEKCYENGWLAFTDDDWLEPFKKFVPFV